MFVNVGQECIFCSILGSLCYVNEVVKTTEVGIICNDCARLLRLQLRQLTDRRQKRVCKTMPLAAIRTSGTVIAAFGLRHGRKPEQIVCHGAANASRLGRMRIQIGFAYLVNTRKHYTNWLCSVDK